MNPGDLPLNQETFWSLWTRQVNNGISTYRACMHTALQAVNNYTFGHGRWVCLVDEHAPQTTYQSSKKEAQQSQLSIIQSFPLWIYFYQQLGLELSIRMRVD